MPLTLRLLLLAGALWMLVFVIRSVRKSRMSAETSFYWIAFAALLVLMGAFPGIVFWITNRIGIESPVNLVFLVILFLLLVHVFSMERKLEKVQHQLTQLTQQYAIDKKEKEMH